MRVSCRKHWHHTCLTLYNDCDELDYCEECVSPDGLRWTFDTDHRLGTDPVALLSTPEHQTLERMLKGVVRRKYCFGACPFIGAGCRKPSLQAILAGVSALRASILTPLATPARSACHELFAGVCIALGTLDTSFMPKK
ncbi:DUF7693 family protein [Pseudomonas viridiflava]|uniref:DUF7693 family protein n=1 Tax=Pseudomonas viridiflava TaxID=33069 RepID=UPI003BFA78E7